MNAKQKIDSLNIKSVSPILIYITVLWIFLSLFIGMTSGTIIIDPTKERSLLISEWGDFLAGFSAPALFLWVMYGINLQRTEFANIVQSFELSNNLNVQ